MSTIDIVMITIMWTLGIGCLSVFFLNITKTMSGWDFLGTVIALPTGALFMALGFLAGVRIAATAAGCG